MKYHINENIKKAVPEKIRKGKGKITLTCRFLTEIMRQKVTSPLLVCFLTWPKLLLPYQLLMLGEERRKCYEACKNPMQKFPAE